MTPAFARAAIWRFVAPAEAARRIIVCGCALALIAARLVGPLPI